MAGVTSIEVKESLDELVQQLQQVETPTDKERLQVLYWLKQEKSPIIDVIAKAISIVRFVGLDQKTLRYYQSGLERVASC